MVSRIRSISNTILNDYSPKIARRPYARINHIVNKYFQDNHDIRGNIDSLLEMINKAVDNEMSADVISSLKERITRILDISDEEIAKTDVSSKFNDAFNGKINSIYNKNRGIVRVKIKGDNNELHFIDNRLVEFSHPTQIKNSATFISDPFDIDDMEGFYISSILKSDLIGKISPIESMSDKKVEPISKILSQNILRDVYAKINQILPGHISYESTEVEYYDSEGFRINVASLSTGMKSFMILKQLIELGKLKEKDILVLDEPEIHLHPEWQLMYAELIVLLQQALDLTVLITTHSSTFLEAIDLYSRIHQTDDKCRYYLATTDPETSMTYFKSVTNNLEAIYKELVTPAMLLTGLRERIGEKNEDKQ